RRLLWWYDQVGRKEDARKLLQRFATTEQVNPGYGGDGYWEFRTLMNGVGIAQELQHVGDFAEGVRLYNKLLRDPAGLAAATQWGGERFEQQIEQGLKTALKAPRPANLPATVRTLLTPRPAAPGTGSVLDPVLLVESPELARASLNSLLATALKSAGNV